MKKLKSLLLLLIAIPCLFLFTGCAGESAYEIAVRNGFSGSEIEWLASLKGADGTNGKDGANGKDGVDGKDGAAGKDGTNGVNGVDGEKGADFSIESIYNVAVQNGYDKDIYSFIKEYMTIEETSSLQFAANKAVLSAVSVRSFFTKTVSTYNPITGTFEDVEDEYVGSGSGVIYKLDKEKGDAYIITNYHVVYDTDCDNVDKISDKIKVYLYGMEYLDYEISASYIGGAMNYDIAVIKVTGSEVLKNSAALEATIGDSETLSLGAPIMAIGNPEGEGIAVTTGVVSCVTDTLEMTGADDYTPVKFRCIRIDAPVNGGNSGGGLFNNVGEYVGVVNAKLVDESVEGIGYAIPINNAKLVADNIIDNCDGEEKVKVYKPLIGVTTTVKTITVEYDEDKLKTEVIHVVYVVEVGEEKAASGKILKDDILLEAKIGDAKITIDKEYKLAEFMLIARVGDTLTLTIEREGVESEVNIELTENWFVEVE